MRGGGQAPAGGDPGDWVFAAAESHSLLRPVRTRLSLCPTGDVCETHPDPRTEPGWRESCSAPRHRMRGSENPPSSTWKPQRPPSHGGGLPGAPRPPGPRRARGQSSGLRPASEAENDPQSRLPRCRGVTRARAPLWVGNQSRDLGGPLSLHEMRPPRRLPGSTALCLLDETRTKQNKTKQKPAPDKTFSVSKACSTQKVPPAPVARGASDECGRARGT